MSIFHPFIIMLTVAEYLCYKLCDEVVSILPLTYPYVKKFGIKPYQFKHVPNGIAITEWEQKTFLPKEIEQVFSNLKEKFVIIYAGSHAESNNLFPIIEYAKHPELSSKVQFILIGDGICKNKLIEQAQLNSLSNITFLPKIEKIHIPSLLAKADLLYFSLLPSPLYDYGISLNKLFDYMMAAKPLLQVNRTSYNLIELANCGVVVEDKTSEVVNTINSLLQADKKCLAALGENGREYVKKYHNYQSLAHKFINNEFKLD
jgi:glycosyltransferase involved in cell wall biosynthesis